MTPAQLRKAGETLFGVRAWQTRMAEEFGVDPSTVRRWVSGASVIPGPAIAAIRCMLGKRTVAVIDSTPVGLCTAPRRE